MLDATYDTGASIFNGAGPVSVAAVTEIETRTTQNVIADLPGVNTDNVVMAGAHLDSVQEGPGINDNGSGSAALLTVALELANNKKYVPQNSLRFAWWGAEESGLVGSTKYIFDPEFGISDEDYAALSSYLNFDMVGSPNFVYGVYDADQSSFEAPVVVPDGSAALEDLFEAYYSDSDIPYDDSEFSGRSDYQAFIDVGIPASGLFTGAEEVKTEQQAAIWGGTAGAWLDPCYHQACDDIGNLSAEALDVNVDAIGYALFNLAASTESVNGVPGCRPPRPWPGRRRARRAAGHVRVGRRRSDVSRPPTRTRAEPETGDLGRIRAESARAPDRCSGGARGAERGDVVPGEAGLEEDLLGVLAELWGDFAGAGRCVAELDG